MLGYCWPSDAPLGGRSAPGPQVTVGNKRVERETMVRGGHSLSQTSPFQSLNSWSRHPWDKRKCLLFKGTKVWLLCYSAIGPLTLTYHVGKSFGTSYWRWLNHVLPVFSLLSIDPSEVCTHVPKYIHVQGYTTLLEIAQEWRQFKYLTIEQRINSVLIIKSTIIYQYRWASWSHTH